MTSRIRLVVFDLAGTTVEDSGHVAMAFRAALAEQGVSMTNEALAGVRGSSKREAIATFIPNGPDRTARANAAYGTFRRHLSDAYREQGVRAIHGAESQFRELRARDIRVALNTGFDRDVTGLLLKALHWEAGVVDAVVCGEDVSQGRPAPFLIFRCMEATGITSVHEVANIGDTALDLRAGHNAGVRWNVGVLTGAHDRSTLEQAPHTHLLGSVADLDALWEQTQ